MHGALRVICETPRVSATVQFDSAVSANVWAKAASEIEAILELLPDILRLADDFPLRRRMGLEGRLDVENRLAWQYSVPALLSVYRRVVGLPERVEDSKLVTTG